MVPVLEARLEARFRSRVRGAGGIVVKLAPTVRGIPDRLVLLPGGRMHLVELKTSSGVLSPAQRAWHNRAHALGTPVTVLYGPDEVDEWVGQL